MKYKLEYYNARDQFGFDPIYDDYKILNIVWQFGFSKTFIRKITIHKSLKNS